MKLEFSFKDIFMDKLNTKQINELVTGLKLAAELQPSQSHLRRFITVFGFTYDNDGQYVSLNHYIKNEHELYFEIRCYEIDVKYYQNHWDVSDGDLLNDIIIDNIHGIKMLEKKLKDFISDLSILTPEWNCDNLI